MLKPKEDIQTVGLALKAGMIPGEKWWWSAKSGATITGGPAASLSDFIKTAEFYGGGKADFYVQLNPSPRSFGTRCTQDDIAAWNWFPIDLDPLPDAAPDDLDTAVARTILLMRGQFGLRHMDPYIVDSGRGRQLWFRLERFDFCSNRASFKRTVRLAQGYWIGWLGRRLDVPNVQVDPSCVDLPRLMRCPGTINTKTGRVASFLELGTPCLGLGDVLMSYAPTSIYVPPAVVQVHENLTNAPWQSLLPHVNATASRFLTEGAEEPGRHRAAVATVKSLAEAGASEPEAIKAITWGGTLCRPPLLDPAYIARTVHAEFEARSRASAT